MATTVVFFVMGLVQVMATSTSTRGLSNQAINNLFGDIHKDLDVDTISRYYYEFYLLWYYRNMLI